MLVLNAKAPSKMVHKVGKLGKAKRIIGTQKKLENIESNFMQIAKRENQKSERALKRANRK